MYLTVENQQRNEVSGMGEESFNEGGILWPQSIQITWRNIPVLPFTKQPPPDKEEILGIGLKYILSDKEGNL